MRSDIDVSLEAPEPAVTVLRYGVKANIALINQAGETVMSHFDRVLVRKVPLTGAVA